jgi:hypothetical protein
MARGRATRNRLGSAPVYAEVATDHPRFLSAEECLVHAEICEHAARLSHPDELQRVLLEVAALWRKRARDAEARSKA